MTTDELKALAKNTPLGDPRRAAMVWAAVEIERRDEELIRYREWEAEIQIWHTELVKLIDDCRAVVKGR